MRNGPAPPIPRLGIAPYNWNTECLRGDAEAPGWATAFPQALGLAAAFRYQPGVLRGPRGMEHLEMRDMAPQDGYPLVHAPMLYPQPRARLPGGQRHRHRGESQAQ